MKKPIDWLKRIAVIKKSTERICGSIVKGKECGNTIYSKWSNYTSTGYRYCLKCHAKESITAHTAFHRLRIPVNVMIEILETMRDNYDGQVVLTRDSYTKKKFKRETTSRPSTVLLASLKGINRKTIGRFLDQAAACVNEDDEYSSFQENPGENKKGIEVKSKWFYGIFESGDIPIHKLLEGNIVRENSQDKYERLYFLLFVKEEGQWRGQPRKTKDIVRKLVTKQPFEETEILAWD